MASRLRWKNDTCCPRAARSFGYTLRVRWQSGYYMPGNLPTDRKDHVTPTGNRAPRWFSTEEGR